MNFKMIGDEQELMILCEAEPGHITAVGQFIQKVFLTLRPLSQAAFPLFLFC